MDVDSSFQIGDLTIETKEDGFSLYGSVDIPRDKRGLATAGELKDVVGRIYRTLQQADADVGLPDVLPEPTPETVKNPF